MYPCPYCHTQLTWVPQYNQYYCYFCHRYVQTSAPPPVAYPQAPVYQPPPQRGYPQPAATQVQQPQPQHVAAPVSPAPVAAAEPAQPAQAQPAKPAVEYAPKGSPPEPAAVPASGQPARGEPVYLCKTCGSKLEVANQRWYCPRCRQYK